MTTANEKPEIDAPEGPAPATLEVTDIIVGDGPEADPAIPPGPGGGDRDGQGAGDLGVVQAVGGGQDDPGAEGDLLRRGVASDERLEVVPLRLGEDDGGRLGPAHGDLRCRNSGPFTTHPSFYQGT